MRHVRNPFDPLQHRLGDRGHEASYRVRYTLASKLVNELVEVADDE